MIFVVTPYLSHGGRPHDHVMVHYLQLGTRLHNLVPIVRITAIINVVLLKYINATHSIYTVRYLANARSIPHNHQVAG